MENISLINNTSVYRNPAPQSPLQGANVMQPAAVYSKIMLRTIELTEADFVFDGLAEERLMPSNNGSNEIVFKRMLSLASHTIPLAEGIPPASDQGRMVAIKASTKQYGRVMEFTDKVNWAVVDPLISEYTRQLSLKVPETKDLLAQEAFYACEKDIEGNDSDILVPKQFGTVTHIKYLTPDCAPVIDEFRKIVLSEEAAKVRPYQGSNFLVLASSAVLFDLITDKRVKEFMKYTNTGSAYSNDMVIDLFSLAFKKAKTIKTDNTFTDENGDTKYIYHAPVYTQTAASGDDPAVYSAANIITSVDLSDPALTTFDAEVVFLDRNPETGAYLYDEATLTGTTLAALTELCNGNFDKLNVHHSFVLGEECLYRIGIEGHSQPEFIKKELGSAGTNDPLNQRQTIGWKLDAIGYKVPNPDAVVDYMSIPTQYRVNVNARPDFKNQFTDYYYGYTDPVTGEYYHPEQVVQSIVWDSTASANVVKYFVKGTTTEVQAVKMTKLVKPVKAGRTDANGKRPVVTGNVPTMQFALKTDYSIRFVSAQVEKYNGKYYIKGLNHDASVEVIALPALNPTQISVPTADGSGYENVYEYVDGGNVNATGHDDIDKI
jgi:N4-gp56 family major capsid protein